nr:peptidoglycan-binding protein [Verrucomicrobiota bacterium]
MKAIAVLCSTIFLCAVAHARADAVTEAVQRGLKEQGFYYGEVTGSKDAETTAALRRYQIRNGLKITGEVNGETQKSLGVKGRAPEPRATPDVHKLAPRAETDLREEPTTRQSREQTVRRTPQDPEDQPPADEAIAPENRGALARTPYEFSAPEEQQRVLERAQSVLARQGYYRSEIDGLYGPGMVFALRAYQARFGLDVSGRLDRETLAVLGLLPGQRAPGVTAPRRSPDW